MKTTDFLDFLRKQDNYRKQLMDPQNIKFNNVHKCS